MEVWFHRNAIKRVIDEFFSEQIKRKELTTEEKILPTVIGINGVEYVFRHIDTRNTEKLRELANKRMLDFLTTHPDNTKELFIDIEIEKARERQKYFPNYKKDTEQKEYYFKLQRYIECLSALSESSPGGTSNDNLTTKLTHLLQLYYEKDCKPLNKPQVEILAEEKSISKSSLVNKWNDLKRDSYRHNGNVNNVKEFMKSYQFLMQHFKDRNLRAYTNVKNHYDQLKETYPDLAY